MNKEQILKVVKEGIDSNQITAVELVREVQMYTGANMQSASVSGSAATSDDKQTLVSKVLYGVGGVIALAGILIFIGENWNNMSMFLKIFVTLGFCLVTYILGFVFYRRPEQDVLSQVFLSLSAITAPIAGLVLLDQLGYFDNLVWSESSMFVSGISLVLYAYALCATRKPMMHLAVIGFFTWFYYALVAELLRGSGLTFDAIADVTIYASMVLAVGVFSYTRFIAADLRNKTIVSLGVFGSFALFLFSAIFLDGIWNFLYAFLLIGAVSLAVQIKRTSALILSAIAIISYLIKISSLYFADSFGWALLLILIGFIVIGVGYLTYYLNRKYISLAR